MTIKISPQRKAPQRKVVIIPVFAVFLFSLWNLQVDVFSNLEEWRWSETMDVPTSNLITEGNRLEFSDYRIRFPVPDWIEEFLTTQPPSSHQELLRDPDEKFIVLTCHKYQNNRVEKCGGLADRLKQIPYWLWLAKKSNRRFLIKFTHPYDLDLFLVPPKDSFFDWRLPDGFFDEEFKMYANRTTHEYKVMRRFDWNKMILKRPWNESRVIFVNNNLAVNAIMVITEKLIGNHTALFPGIFRRLFQPSDGVRKAIQETAQDHGLVAGQYAAAHLRLKYPLSPGKRLILLNKGGNGDEVGGGISMDNITQWNIHTLSENIINCAMKIMPEASLVYFASDTNEAAEYLLRKSHWSQLVLHNSSLNVTDIEGTIPKIGTRLDFEEEPMHFEGGIDVSPRDLYPAFVDQWIVGHAKCVAHGVGGFPLFASALTGNYESCREQIWSKRDGVQYCPHYLNRFGMNLSNRLVIPH